VRGGEGVTPRVGELDSWNREMVRWWMWWVGKLMSDSVSDLVIELVRC